MNAPAGPGAQAVPAPKRPRYGLWQWIVIVVSVLAISALLIADVQDQASRGQGRSSAGCVGAVLAAAAHAAWISLDRARHGRKAGAWRFFAILFGPLAIWVYLAWQYGLRSMYLIPLSMLIYATVLGVPVLYYWVYGL